MNDALQGLGMKQVLGTAYTAICASRAWRELVYLLVCRDKETDAAGWLCACLTASARKAYSLLQALMVRQAEEEQCARSRALCAAQLSFVWSPSPDQI